MRVSPIVTTIRKSVGMNRNLGEVKRHRDEPITVVDKYDVAWEK